MQSNRDLRSSSTSSTGARARLPAGQSLGEKGCELSRGPHIGRLWPARAKLAQQVTARVLNARGFAAETVIAHAAESPRVECFAERGLSQESTLTNAKKQFTRLVRLRIRKPRELAKAINQELDKLVVDVDRSMNGPASGVRCEAKEMARISAHGRLFGRLLDLVAVKMISGSYGGGEGPRGALARR